MRIENRRLAELTPYPANAKKHDAVQVANVAEQNGRRAYCMELDPKYVDVIIDRWEKFTGRRAVCLSEKEV